MFGPLFQNVIFLGLTLSFSWSAPASPPLQTTKPEKLNRTVVGDKGAHPAGVGNPRRRNCAPAARQRIGAFQHASCAVVRPCQRHDICSIQRLQPGARQCRRFWRSDRKRKVGKTRLLNRRIAEIWQHYKFIHNDAGESTQRCRLQLRGVTQAVSGTWSGKGIILRTHQCPPQISLEVQ